MDFAAFSAAQAQFPNLHWADAFTFLSQQGQAQIAVAEQLVAALRGGNIPAILTVLSTTLPGEIQFGVKLFNILQNGTPAS